MNSQSLKTNRTLLAVSLILLAAFSVISHWADGHLDDGPVICLFKRFTGIPCPTCGVTRSMVAILNGEIYRGVLLNPIGLVIILALVVLPFWTFMDLRTGKASLLGFWRRSEVFMVKWYVLLPLILLTIANWSWNIEKGL